MRKDVIELTSRLVAADSVNPSLVRGGAGESAAARVVMEWAAAAGLEAEVLERVPTRPSVVVRARGSGGGPTLLLCGHLDTVGVGRMESPHAPRVDHGRLYGRGAYDMKAGLAAALLAARDAATLDLPGDVVVAAVADEEHASLGIREVLEHVSADAAVVTEPTDLEVVVAHKGFAWFQLSVHGRAAHGSRPDLGIDAIVRAGRVLTALGELDDELGSCAHPLLGRASVHASLISGGTELSSYAPACVVGLERRTLPGESAAVAEAELRRIVEGCRDRNGSHPIELRTLLVREPFAIPRDAGIVDEVVAAAADVLGRPPPIVGASYWTDAAFIAAAGIPTVLFGPSGAGAHADEEWVSVSATESVVRTLVRLAGRVCA